MKRVVVTGIGVVVPGGVGAERFWRSNVEGTSRVRYEPLMAELGLKSRAVAAIDGFRLADHHSDADTAELSRLSRFVQLSVTAGKMACEDARLADGGFVPERAGTVMSSAIGGTPEFQRAYEQQSDHGTVPLRPFTDGEPFYDSVFLNFPPSWLARRFGLRGPSSTLTTGCTAGIDSLGLAFEQIRHGELDIVLAGSGEAPLSGLAYSTLDVIGSLSTADVPPEQASRPFDAKRAGFVLGEGAAALVVEEYEHAMARGATCYAEVMGFASSNNAFHMSDLAQDGMSMTVVLEGALRDAGIPPAAVDYVNAHGSSTPQNDLFETVALKRVLGAEHARRTPVSSTKSMIGHSLASASLVGTIAGIGALRHCVVPPTINYEVPDPRCDLDYVPNRARAHDVRTVMVTASGFGGIHSCAVLRRVGEPIRDWWSPTQAETSRVNRTTVTGVRAPALVSGPMDAFGQVLFLHGFGGTAAHWEPMMRCLGPDVRAMAVDLPGHGGNRLAVDADRSRMRRFLRDVLDELGAPGEVAVVGHSLGGLVALDLAAACPERVGRVAVIGTAARIRLFPRLLGQLAAGVVDDDFLAAAIRDQGTPEAATARQLVVEGFRTLRFPARRSGIWGLGDPVVPVAGIRMPSLVVIADSDRVVSPRKSRLLAAELPDSRTVVLPGTDHYVHLERPAEVWRAIRGFVTQPHEARKDRRVPQH